MSRYRVQRWAVFSKRYLLYDAFMQCPMLSGEKIAMHLKGKQKRIYAEGEDHGDFVIAFNTRHIAAKNNSYYWKRIMYPIHTKFGTRRLDVVMEDFHAKDPCDIIRKEVRTHISRSSIRSDIESRLLLFPDGLETIPRSILEKVSGVIRQVLPVPKRLDEYSPEEIQQFPKLFDFPEDFELKPLSPLEKPKI